MEYTDIRYEVTDGVATITLNRPDHLNAATFDMGEQFLDAIGDAEGSDSVRAVILTGAGKGFCSGDDVAAAWGDPRMEATLKELGSARAPLTPEINALRTCTKPTIAAVNGVALGIGMDFAVMCDVVLASEKARFGQLFVRMGLMADVTGLWKLPQLIGPAKAAELLLTGDMIDAATAERIGLVARVLPPEDLLPAAQELAAKIAANPPLAVRYIKEGLRRGANRGEADLPELGAFVGSALSRLFQSEDHKEAAAAFMEKRTATFTGR
jgi:enoyl-CoA hydratase/carnithine racemase